MASALVAPVRWERAVVLLEDAQKRQVDVSQVMVGKARVVDFEKRPGR